MSSFDSMRMTNAWNVSVIPILLLYPFIGIKKKKKIPQGHEYLSSCHSYTPPSWWARKRGENRRSGREE